MVVICLPAASPSGTQQERVAHAVDMDRAGAALRDAAAVFGAGQADVFAQIAHSSGVSGSTSTSKLFPLTERMAMFVFSMPDRRR